MRKIAAVTFDLWDTLIQEYPDRTNKVAQGRIERIRALLERKGILHTAQEIEEAYTDTGRFLELTWSKKRDMDTRDQILFMLSSLDDKLAARLDKADLAEIEKVYSSGLLENPPRLLPGAMDVLRSVSSKGYKVGLISNTGRTPGSVLRVLLGQMAVLDFFDATTFSNETLVRKPAESVFRLTLDNLRAVPKASVHVGDSEESDVRGAKAVGMYAIHLTLDGGAGSKFADVHVRSLDSVAEAIEKL
jgi:putative hydrolase of the HAD superfamily